MKQTTKTTYEPFVWLLMATALVASWFLLIAPPAAFGQADTGRITGTVSDSAGAVVPAVEVVITAVDTNRRFTATTDDAGRYSSPPLRAGMYQVEAELSGFKRLVRQGIALAVQETAVVNLQLELGAVTEQVTVTASQDLIQTVDASQGQVIEARRVADLPLNGRDYLQLSLLSEGALEPPGQGRSATGANSGTESRAGGFSAGGLRTTDNNYLLDGFDNNTDDTSFDSNQAESVKPSVDAIQEFKVQTNAYSAEFGRAAGGVVNLTLKSGTNQFHGSAYEFVRNDNFDARNFFDPGVQPPFNRNNYGASFGGPIMRDRAFFFVAYERLDRRESRTVNNTIPTANMRSGNFGELANPIYDPLTYEPGTRTRQPFPNKLIPETRIDNVANQLIDYYPAPQNTRLSQNYIFNPPDREKVNRFNTRNDFQLSDKDHLSWMFNYQSNDIPASTGLPAPAFGGNTRATDVTGHSTGLTWTRVISPSMVTSTKLGWDANTFLINFSPEAIALGDVASKVGLDIPASTLDAKFPTMSIAGFSSLGVGNFLPVWSNGETRQFKSDTSWTSGDHAVKFGADVQWIQTNNLNGRREGGEYSFNGRYTNLPTNNSGGSSVADFLLGAANTEVFSTNTRVSGRAKSLGGYIQDDWRATSRLSLNLGVRYEYFDPFVDTHNRMINVDLDTDPNNPRLVYAAASVHPSFITTDTNNFQPRLGFAYQLIPEKFVLRGGYGIYFPLPKLSPFGDSDSLLVNPPYNVEINNTGDGITSATMLEDGTPDDALALQNARSVSLASTQQDPDFGYAEQWNVNMQYQIAPNWMLQVGYFGTTGTNLVNKVDANYIETLGPGNLNARRRFKSIFVPTSVPSGAGPVQGVTVSPIGAILRQVYNGTSDFHSLQAKVEHQFSNGFTVLGSYIWSKALSDAIGDNGMGQSPGSGFQNMANLRAERGLADTHLSQRFVVSGIWDLPFGRGMKFGGDMHPVADAILGGWSLGSLVTLTAGRPFNVTVNGDPANSGQTNRADVVGDWRNVPGGSSVSQFFNTAAFARNQPFSYGNLGRNSLIGPSYQNVDFSMMKRTTLFSTGDQPWDLQLRWEVFNLFNHTNFGFPGGTLGNPTFGQLTSASPGRKMQGGIKIIF